jgi:hypothetical protein
LIGGVCAAVIWPLAARCAASSRCWLFTSWQVRNSTATACAKSGRFKWYRFGISFFAFISRIVQSQTEIGITGAIPPAPTPESQELLFASKFRVSRSREF